MNVLELLNMDASKVRGNSNLMRIYIDFYKEAFGVEPNCAGCTFKKDFNKLKKHYAQDNQKNIKVMETKQATFKYKRPQGKILSYKSGNATVRRYDNLLTEEFVIGYLTNGTPEQLEERKKQFSILPKQLTEVKEIEVVETQEKEEITEIQKAEKPKKKSGRKLKTDK